MKIVSIVGARPEFVQAVALSKALRRRHREVLVHTGQHYDYLMSQAFFEELALPTPAYTLEVGPGTRLGQLTLMLERLEATLAAECPDAVLVRGDTTSTLAGAIAAKQMDIPLVHVEAGERSYDPSMPEEVSRVATDHLADVHFCVSRTGVRRLATEGIRGSVYWVGDVMLDTLLDARATANLRSKVLERLGLRRGRYALVTIHRAGNTDDPARLAGLVTALNAAPEEVVFPIHPRTSAALERIGARWAAHVRAIPPVGYFDMIALCSGARLVATDSGGLQREAYFFGVPCLTLREETEWVETVETGWNTLVGVDPGRILEAWSKIGRPAARPPIFGDGHAAERIVEILDAGAIERARSTKRSRAPLPTGGSDNCGQTFGNPLPFGAVMPLGTDGKA
jgi:UDP-GlcNAc3NAcA epimerase